MRKWELAALPPIWRPTLLMGLPRTVSVWLAQGWTLPVWANLCALPIQRTRDELPAVVSSWPLPTPLLHCTALHLTAVLREQPLVAGEIADCIELFWKPRSTTDPGQGTG